MRQDSSEARIRAEEMIVALDHLSPGLAADVVQIEPDTWAVYGSIPGDGEVILAEFHPPESPVHALEEVSVAESHLLIEGSREVGPSDELAP